MHRFCHSQRRSRRFFSRACAPPLAGRVVSSTLVLLAAMVVVTGLFALRSGATNQPGEADQLAIVITSLGSSSGFATSVDPLDVIVGVPYAGEDHRGRAYVLFGAETFDPETQLANIATLSDLRLISPFSDDDLFGQRVGALYDLDGDGMHEVRVMSIAVDHLGEALELTHVFSGANGRWLFTTAATDTFDPWANIPGDVTGDGAVTQRDLELILANMGLAHGGAGIGDLNGDGVVDALDLAIVLDNLGNTMFGNISFNRDGTVSDVHLPDGERLPQYQPIGLGHCQNCQFPCRPHCCGFDPCHEECNYCTYCTPSSGSIPDECECGKWPLPCFCDDLANPCTCEPNPCECDEFPDPCDCNEVSVELIMDYANGLGFSLPPSLAGLDPEEAPGKIIFTNIGDSDGDGIPDFADGYGHPDAVPESNHTLAQFIPMELKFTGIDDVSEWEITFAYSDSDPLEVVVTNHGQSPHDWKNYEAAPGRLRIWLRDGQQQRDPMPVDDDGDYIPSGTFNLSDVVGESTSGTTLYVEAIRPSDEPGGDTIVVSLRHNQGSSGGGCSFTATVTAAEVEFYDILAWKPILNAGPKLENANLWIPQEQFRVGGAVADGSSICLVRINPKMQLPWDPFNPNSPYWSIRITRQDAPLSDPSSAPAVVGSIEPVFSPNGTNHTLPGVPYIDPSKLPPSSTGFSDGIVFYVPPVSYIDQLNAGGGEHLSNDEVTHMEFRIRQDTTVLGRMPFRLRRPPLVLVHGMLSDPTTWPASVYNENLGMNPLPTRMYRVDYSGSHLKGYSENFPILAKAINNALRQYRRGLDDDFHSEPQNLHMRPFEGIKYAATRVDVVAHSLGGQIARLYASNINSQLSRGGIWRPFNATRTESPPYDWWSPNGTGRYPYLRADNYGAGDIRRLITIGSPFKGSPLANTVAPIFEPKPENRERLQEWAEGALPGMPPMPDALRHQLFPNSPTNWFYDAPTCLADLSTNSVARQTFEMPNRFPSGNRAVQWFPMVGIATDNVGAGVLYDLLIQFLGSKASQSLLDYFFSVRLNAFGDLVFDDHINELNPNTSDLIVSESSQRNGVNVPVKYYWHPHIPLPIQGLLGETESPVMAMHIRNLLSSRLNGISLPTFPDHVPNTVNGVAFFELGQGN